jgi:hypothetical protein
MNIYTHTLHKWVNKAKLSTSNSCAINMRRQELIGNKPYSGVDPCHNISCDSCILSNENSIQILKLISNE